MGVCVCCRFNKYLISTLSPAAPKSTHKRFNQPTQEKDGGEGFGGNDDDVIVAKPASEY